MKLRTSATQSLPVLTSLEVIPSVTRGTADTLETVIESIYSGFSYRNSPALRCYMLVVRALCAVFFQLGLVKVWKIIVSLCSELIASSSDQQDGLCRPCLLACSIPSTSTFVLLGVLSGTWGVTARMAAQAEHRGTDSVALRTSGTSCCWLGWIVPARASFLSCYHITNIFAKRHRQSFSCLIWGRAVCVQIAGTDIFQLYLSFASFSRSEIGMLDLLSIRRVWFM